MPRRLGWRRGRGAGARSVRTHRPGGSPASAMFWRVLTLNGLIFAIAAAALAVSPATVSVPVTLTEVGVLAGGLLVMIAMDAVLLRASLRPLDGLTDLMARVDLLRPGERLAVNGSGDVAHLIHTFNEMLDRLEAERGASAARALAAQEGERQRIAQELHDEIGQSLTAVLLGLKRAIDRAPPELREELRAVQDITRSSVNEVRQVARRLRPGVLDDLGLASAMTALAADFSKSSQIPTSPRLGERLPRLDAAAELVIYRIAQESLTNIARHAHATHVALSLTARDNRVVLRVADDGRGMNGATEGAGIRGMRERAILIGAELTVAAGETGGTEVRLVVPHHAGSAVA